MMLLDISAEIDVLLVALISAATGFIIWAVKKFILYLKKKIDSKLIV